MDRSMAPSRLTAISTLVIAALCLTACGVKPKINDLAVPERKSDGETTKTVIENPASGSTLDGKVDKKTAIPVEREDRSFILDFLL